MRGWSLAGGRVLVAAALAICGLGTAAASDAGASVAVGVEYVGARSRLVVSIGAPQQTSPGSRAQAVSVRYGRLTYGLRRATSSRYGSVWRSSLGSGLGEMVGRRVIVAVRALSGVTSSRRIVQGSRFKPPARSVRGDEAFQAIKPYFVNSRFTDCAGSGCAREQRYSHCAGGDREGTWRHRAAPVGVGPTDGTYRVTAAFQNTNGSWGVTYTVTHPGGATSTYSWVVQPSGAALGVYQVGGEVGTFEDFHWRQPAEC